MCAWCREKKLEIDYPVLMLLLQEVPVQQQDFEIVEQGKKTISESTFHILYNQIELNRVRSSEVRLYRLQFYQSASVSMLTCSQ